MPGKPCPSEGSRGPCQEDAGHDLPHQRKDGATVTRWWADHNKPIRNRTTWRA